MPTVAPEPGEAQRLAALDRYDLLNLADDCAIDELTALAARTLGTPAAALSVVGESFQFLQSRHGFTGRQTPREHAFCDRTIREPGGLFVVPDAAADPRFADNPLVTEGIEGGLRVGFYAGVALVDPDGHALGTLCALDERPRELTEDQVHTLRVLARQAMHLLELRRERRDREKQRAQLEELSLIVNATDSAVIVTDADCRISYVNPAFTRISGYPAEEAIGRIPGRLLQGPDTDPQTTALMRERIAAGEGFEVTILNYHKNGAPYWLELEVRPVRDDRKRLTNFIAIERDVTEQRRTLQALRESEEQQARIASNVPGMVYRYEAPADGSVRFTYVSDGSRGVYGIEPAEILADPMVLLGRVHPDDVASLVERTDEVAASGEPLDWTGRHLPGVVPGADTCPVHAGDTVRWLHVVGRSGFDGAGGTVTDGVVIDVTDRVVAEEQVRAARALAEEASRAAEAAAARAEEANRAKSRFLANMSHEIRTPLNGVIGMTDLLMRKELNPTQAGYAEVIKSSAQSLLSLINDVLDFSKIEAGKLELSPVDFCPREVIGDVMQMLARPAAVKGLEVAAHVEPTVPERLHGDENRLRQVLVNLFNNAIKFTESGEVVVRVGPWDAASGTGSQPAAGLRVEVADSGMGIPEERRDRLFRSFSQVDASTTRKFGGTGLGLAISRQLVELMGGRIGVRSEEGVGSTFWFTVAMPAVAEPVARQRAGFAGMRALVVDDHHASLVSVADQLACWGLEVSHATRGEAALHQARAAAASGRPFDAAVVDLRMPGISGLEVGRALKADPTLASTRLLMLTAADREVDPAELHAAGFEVCLGKPARPSQLFDALMGVLLGEPPASAPAPTSDTPAAGSRGRLLLAEDNQINQRVATEMLGEAGYTCHVVPNGRLAVEAVVGAEDGRFDLVLMDCQMPELDGFGATAAIRAHELETGAARIPIVALTANAVDGDRQRCLAAGMDGYVSKPIDLEKLTREIERLIPRRSEPSTTAAEPQCALEGVVTRAGEAIDLDALLRRCGGKAALVAQLLEAFAARLGPEVEEIGDACEAGEAERAALLAHTLKGTAANLSADLLSAVAGEVEQLALAGRLEEASTRLPTLGEAAAGCGTHAGTLVAHLRRAA